MQDIEKIYEEEFKTVYKYILCLTHNSSIAEELTQETFYRAIQKIDTFKGNCKLSVWLCQIAKNLWYDELRKKQKQEKLENMLTFKTESSLEEILILNDNKLDFYQYLQKLDEPTREVFYLRILGELSFKEIATILGKTTNWACVTFSRGKKKLKEVIKNERRSKL